jgi:hypothetical protein
MPEAADLLLIFEELKRQAAALRGGSMGEG